MARISNPELLRGRLAEMRNQRDYWRDRASSAERQLRSAATCVRALVAARGKATEWLKRLGVVTVLLIAVSIHAQVGPGQPFASQSAYREWLTMQAAARQPFASEAAYRAWLAPQIAAQMQTPSRFHPLTAAAATAPVTQTLLMTATVTVVSAPPPPPPPVPQWYTNATLTVASASAKWNGDRRTFEIALTDQLTSDAQTASRWADGANAKCTGAECSWWEGEKHVKAYDYLYANPAAYRGFRDHPLDPDPVVHLCLAGYDSPLAHYTERLTFNRTQAELDDGLTLAKVQFNAHDYPGWIVPADCLAGCFVYVEIPCVGEHQVTIIELFKPGGNAPGKCIGYRNGQGFDTSACVGGRQ